MIDDFEAHAPSLTAPASAADAITPNDTSALPHVTRAIYVGVGGELTVEMLSGDIVVFSNVQAGVLFPLRVTKVLATGTSAAALLGLY